MFWSARQKRIKARAKSLGDLVLMTKGRIETMQFDEVIEACHRDGLVDGHVDRGKQQYRFFESDPKEAEFAFNVDFKDRSLRVEGFRRYGMFLLTASAQSPAIGFQVMPPLFVGPDQRAGPDAAALASELGKVPGFMDMNRFKSELGLP